MLMIDNRTFWILLEWAAAHSILVLFVAAVVGGVVGWRRGRVWVGPACGIAGGGFGGVVGFVLYAVYEHKAINPPPPYVVNLYICGGSLVLASLCAAVFVKRPKAPTGNANNTRPNSI
jgi:hypothetical protein